MSKDFFMSTPYVTTQDLSLTFGLKPLFQQVSFSLFKGDRVCLVGRNGSGKSTLLKVLAKQMDPDHGELFIHPKLTCAYLCQDLDLPDHTTAHDYIFEQEDMDHHRALSFLDKLSVRPHDDMRHFSGGERRRLALALSLAQDSDILLLDEPTNHLDIQAIEWLESYIARFKGTLVVISHDRSFLKATTNRTFWLHRQNILDHSQGYQDFPSWSDRILADEEREAERLDVKLKQENHWLHRGVTARRKRNQGRLRQLHDLRAQKREQLSFVSRSVAMEGPSTQVHWNHTDTSSAFQKSSTCVMEAIGISKTYGERTLFSNFSTRIMRGDRIGVIGPNGTGKTTLLNILVGRTQPDQGTVTLGETLDLVYFDQMRKTLDGHKSLWENLCPHGGDHVTVFGHDRHVVGYLKDFLFDEHQVHGKASILSGGEKNRLALAKALTQKSNVLVLDEPTNDLDMETLDVLEDMLMQYPGTIIVVSHDRDFLNQTVTSVLALEGNGTIQEYVGGYDDYLVKKQEIAKRTAPSAPKSTPEKHQTKPSTPTSSKRLSYHEKRRLEMLPQEIEAAESKVHTLSESLNDPDLYARDPKTFARITHELDMLKQSLHAMEEEWLELSMKQEES